MARQRPHQFLTMFPLVFIKVLKLCGMLPFSPYFQSDWKLSVYSIILLLVCVLVKVTTVFVVNYSDKVNKEEVLEINRAVVISQFVKIIYPIIKSLIPFVAIINAFLKRRFMYNLCSYLCKSDELIEGKELSILLKKQLKLTSKLVVLSLGISLTAKLCSVMSLVFIKDLREWQVLLWVVLMYLIDTIGLVTEIQYVLMSVSLRTRFLQLNSKLESLFSEPDFKVKIRIEKFAEEWESVGTFYKERVDIRLTNTSMITPSVSLLSHKFDNYSKGTCLFQKEFLQVKNKHDEIVEFLKCLKRLRLRHRYLCAALYQLNLMFEHVLLISIFSLFIMILLNIYSAIFSYARDLLLSNLLDNCFWLLSSLIRLIHPLVVTDSLVDQARRTVELLSTFATRDITNISLKEVQEFSDEVNSRKLRVTCAFNLFSVKTELLTAAVAAGTTYIVTLIQLH